MKRLFACVVLCLLSFNQATSAEPFRTDGGNEKLPWYQIQPGVFPPEGSAHYFSGELIQVDHVNRNFVLRVDRTDSQNRSHWDLPAQAAMLPFGSISYHGAPAALEDIPLGTHLHGLFYLKDPNDKSKPLEGWHSRVSYEADFRRCFRLEDDFSYYSRQNQQWLVDKVDLAELKLTATLQQAGKPVGKPKRFDLAGSTRIWRGNGIATAKDLAAGQLAQLNITWATLYGPGRLREVWIDQKSRELATKHQIEKHHLYTRHRGLAGWIDEVDNQKRVVTITLFDGVDPELFAALKKDSTAGIAPAIDSLLMFDPVNDRKRGPILEVKKVPLQPGCSGVQIRVQPNLLLEGYRPKRIVRVYPETWPVVALPKEEQFFGRE